MPGDPELRDGFDYKITHELVSTFDQIAKTAMQASAEFSNPDSKMSVLERSQKAHSAITLIMDDAMRGLSTAVSSAIMFAVMLGAESVDDEHGES